MAAINVAAFVGNSLMSALEDCRSMEQVERFGKGLHDLMATTEFPNVVAAVIEEARTVYGYWRDDPNGMYAAIYGEVFDEEKMYEAAMDAWASRAYGADPAWAQ